MGLWWSRPGPPPGAIRSLIEGGQPIGSASGEKTSSARYRAADAPVLLVGDIDPGRVLLYRRDVGTSHPRSGPD